MKKQVELTDDVSVEFLKDLVSFLKLHHDKAETKGDLELLETIATCLYVTVGFYNEDGEEIDILKGGNNEQPGENREQ